MNQEYDAIIIGSGFGGTMTAKKLLDAGWNVAIIERGEWIKRGPHNWSKTASIDLTPNYDKSLPYNVVKGGNKPQMGVYTAVGGPSLFYGGVSFRFREQDFKPPSDIVADSGAEWPINYGDLSPYYDEAETLLQVAGESGIDPTEPQRNQAFPQRPREYAEITTRIKNSAESLGHHPFHLPLAINYEDSSRAACQLCTTCDTFACAISAKNDLDTMLLSKMVNGNLKIYSNTIAHELKATGATLSEIHCIDRNNNEKLILSAKVCVLSAGALASPHLILSSGLEKLNPAGDIVGRYLMRHLNTIIFGIFPGVADKQNRFHKELAIMDFYLGHKDVEYPKNKIGSLQQVPTPPSGLVEHEAPKPLGKFAGKAVKLLTGLLAIAEDQPQYSNLISVDTNKRATYNMGTPYISHEYSARDHAAMDVLIAEAKKIMKKSGAWVNYVHNILTFSHAAGTIRIGNDANTAPLDLNCNFRGIDNLYVVDACFMPTSAAVNPSLTISANALRVGDYLVQKYSNEV